MNESPVGTTAAARRRGLLLIWCGQLFMLALLYFLTYVIEPQTDAGDNHTLAWVLGAVGFTTFLGSFLVKRKLLAEAAAKRRFDLGTTAYILAFAMCESTAILGFVAYLVTGLPYALHSFILAAVGILLHFPARDALEGIGSGGNPTGADFKTTL
ncbi:MAG TPA: hypothetical protein VGB61_13935 [Pyrinomonadaceae bacterium]|jgi:hypothetical protein